MLKDSKGLKITLLVIVLIIMLVNFLPGETYSSKQQVMIGIKDSYNLSIKTVTNDVSVIVDPTATNISASYSGSGRTKSKLTMEQNGSNVTISEKYSNKNFLGIFNVGFGMGGSPHLTVVLPGNAALQGFSVESVSGDISIDTDITAGTIKLASTGGDIDFLNLQATAGNIQISTISGYIEGYQAVGTNVKLSTTSGTIEVYQIDAKDITINSVSGDIYGMAAPGNGTLKMKTVSGEIDMQLDPQTNATVNAKSVSGEIQLGRSTEQFVLNNATTVIGDGTGSITADTTSGDITISW